MQKRLKLILPNKKYVSSYIGLEKEFQTERSKMASGGMDPLTSAKDFPAYCKKATDKQKGVDIPRGKVPATMYWAVVGNKVVGRLNLRHRLSKRLRVMGGNIGYAVRRSERRKGYAKEMLR